MVIQIPAKEEFLRGCAEYERHEGRDSMYKVATFLVKCFWGKPEDMADALGVLLLTWNQALYRYDPPDFDELSKCIADNMNKINHFRQREITTFSASDETSTQELFERFLDALKTKKSGRKSSWYTIRTHQRPSKKRSFRKLHLACECVEKEKPIYSWVLTSALRHDSPRFRTLLKRIHGKIGDVCADKANSCRENTQLVKDMGGRPFLMPRKNASTKVKGHQA